MANKPDIKAIFIDIDGTLLSWDSHCIPQSSIDALNQAHRQGYLLFVATGRHPLEMAQVQQLPAIPFDGYVTMDGQFCYSGQQVVHENPLPKADLEVLVDHLRAGYPHACLFSTRDGQFLSLVDERVRQVCQRIGVQPPEVCDLQRALDEPILQAGLYLGDEGVPPFVAKMAGCKWTFWHKYAIDITPKNGGKWVGVQKMAAHFGLAPAQLLTIGDNHNDKDMLAGAGLSIAMGNGNDEAKAAACHVAGHIDQDGLAAALEQLLGIRA